MSLARKVAREKAAPRRRRLTKALQRARRDRQLQALADHAHDLALGPIADVADFEIDDLEGVEVNTVRKFAGVAFGSLVVLYVLAWAFSGC